MGLSIIWDLVGHDEKRWAIITSRLKEAATAAGPSADNKPASVASEDGDYTTGGVGSAGMAASAASAGNVGGRVDPDPVYMGKGKGKAVGNPQASGSQFPGGQYTHPATADGLSPLSLAPPGGSSAFLAFGGPSSSTSAAPGGPLSPCPPGGPLTAVAPGGPSSLPPPGGLLRSPALGELPAVSAPGDDPPDFALPDWIPDGESDGEG